MSIYITKINGFFKSSTAQAAQTIVADIAGGLGIKEMGLYRYDNPKETTESLSGRFDGIIAGLNRDDIVIFQFPTWNPIEWEQKLLERIQLYGGRIIIFVHDIIPLMFKSNQYLLTPTIDVLNQAEVLIVPSVPMYQFLLQNGLRKDMKFVVQEIWDYPVTLDFSVPQFQKIIHFAGSPAKFSFPNEWNYTIPLKLYAHESCSGQNVQSLGWMQPIQLLLELAKGGFGLVWYGDDYMHQYMQYNCNFKLSSYLVAGIPVIVPCNTATQELVEKNHLGIAVNSLEEAITFVSNTTEQEYQTYTQHIKNFSFLLKNGYFTKKLLIEAIHKLQREPY